MNNRSKIKSPGDLVCCLPEEYLKDIQVSFASLAGQNGSLDAPRVFLMNKIDAGDKDTIRIAPLSCVLTLNAHGVESSNYNNVEMACLDKKTLRADYFDIDLAKTFPVSAKNPEACMTCHGKEGREPANGPRTIFDPDERWPRFLNGFDRCYTELKPYLQAVHTRTLKELATRDAYRCVDPGDLKFGHSPLSRSLRFFDNHLEMTQAKRLLAHLKTTPDFDKFRHLLYAHHLLCDMEKIEQWIPAERLRTMTNRQDLLPEVVQAENLSELVSARLREQQEAQKANFEAANALIPDILSGKATKAIVPHRLMCPDTRRDPKPASTHSTFAQFWADTRIRGFREVEQSDYVFRFLFESRGITLSDWGMGVTADTYTSVPPLGLTGMLAYEMEEGFRKQGHPWFQDRLTTLGHHREVCEMVRKKSLEALRLSPTASEKPVRH